MKSAKINLGKNRLLLSDILPYELPIIFSNWNFLDFVRKYDVCVNSDGISWNNMGPKALNKIICWIVLGEDFDNIKNMKFMHCFDGANCCIKKIDTATKNKRNKIYKDEEKNTRNYKIKIPFQYEIKHKKSNCRKLTLIHPFNQLQMVNFYDKYKDLVLYYCSLSSFSLRHPDCIATRRYYKDSLHNIKLSNEEIGIEEYDKEYESIKTFFAYKKYSNIYKFYDSFKFNRCEKKYNKLLKLDITKCFDSIYTHSLSWATYNKDYVKQNLDNSKGTFADNFDQLMQNMNYQETNGIVIGPEFSRIFAEIILQKIDNKLLNILRRKYKLKEKIDYEIYRYVDDYFIFYNNDLDKENIITELQEILLEYKLHLNDSKTKEYDKPIITEISMAKQKISKLIDETLSYSSVPDVDKNGVIIKNPDNSDKKIVKIQITAKTFIVEFKSIVKESKIEYLDILNYAFYVIEEKLQKLFSDFSKLCKFSSETENKFFYAMQQLLECVIFLYSVSPKVANTIRFTRIMKQYVKFYSRNTGNTDYKETAKIHKEVISGQIYSDIHTILMKNKPSEYTQIETSYLLTMLQELGGNYYLPQEEIESYFQITRNKDDNNYNKNCSLNYLSLMIILFYTKGKKQYETLINFVSMIIKEKLLSEEFDFNKCEDLLLFLDTLACPYVNYEIKTEILRHNGVKKHEQQEQIINLRKSWFITWDGFNLKKELDKKKGQEVY